MEDIKTGIEKIFDQFSSDSMVYGNPKRLSYNYTPESASKKRKLSPNQSQSNTSAISIPDDSHNNTAESLNTSQTLSVFEIRRLKADIMDYKTRLTELKGELESRHVVQKQMDTMHTTKVTSLEKQLGSSEAKLRESDKYLKLLRRREAASKEELIKTQNEHAQYKRNSETVIGTLQRAKTNLEETLRHTQFQLNEQIRTLTNQYHELETNYQSVREDLETYHETNGQLQERAHQCTQLEAKCEVQRNDLERANRRIAELESEIAAFGDWKDMSKTFQQRIAKVPDLEKEIEHLRRDNKNIHDAIGNKLLLEEEAHSLKSRLTDHERTQKELIQLQTITKSMETELRDYQTLAKNYLGAQTTVTPANWRDRIEEILRNDVVMVNEKSSASNEQKSAIAQVQTMSKEMETLVKTIDNLQTSLKYHKTSMHRVQKKLSLVAKERDCYKQLIDNYEKDLTISGAVSEMNPESQIRLKLDMLEKSVDGYKDVVQTLERDLQMAKNLPDLGLVDTISAENYEAFKKEMQLLRTENERLSQSKKELEILIEQLSIKGAYNIEKFKVLHMSMNPSAEAQEEHKVELEKLQAEIERLKRKNRQLEQDHADLTVRMNDTANITSDLKEMSSLREQLKSLESKYKHQKDLYKHASQEYREVCYMLFGYRVDRIGTNNFRVSSVYAESEHDYLNFRVSEAGSLDMLSNHYSLTLTDMVNTYLGEQQSLPAFLCTLNLELFNRTTMAMQHQQAAQ